MAEPEKCYLKHEAPNHMRYETTINRPGQEPERIVCCKDCGMAIAMNEQRLLPENADPQRRQTMEQAFADPAVHIPKPVRIPDPPRLERSIGLDPPGYGYGR